MQKPKALEYFRGTTKENPRKWKNRLENYIARCGYENEPQKMLIVDSYLEDAAWEWYRDLPEGSKDTFNHFLEAFEAAYCAQGTQHSTEQALMSRVMGENEDPDAYVNDVIVKGKLVGWNADRIIQHMIVHVPNHMKALVMVQQPHTLQEARKAIMTVYNATKDQARESQEVQSVIKDLAVALKQERAEKKVNAVQSYVQPQLPNSYVTQPVQPQVSQPMVPATYPVVNVTDNQVPVYQGNNGPQQGNYVPQQQRQQNPSQNFSQRRRNNRGGNGSTGNRPVLPNIIIHNGRTPTGPRRNFPNNAGGFNRNFNRGNFQNSQGYGQNQGSRVMSGQSGCWTCGSNTHFQAECPQMTITCFKCNLQGHVQANCPMNNRFQRRTGPGRGRGRPIYGMQGN